MGGINNIGKSINSFYANRPSIPNESGDFENEQRTILRFVLAAICSISRTLLSIGAVIMH